ncbi:hypothetical protein [Nocardia sp. SYP-A9097]|uniref:hypothetical protein n=1 Tax=Nocardia sp. SYP-A9097 TaxID=2663237 RepID=UPI00129A0C1A|nr:hypothetical protein [Nocardia sp. SYP-A9097]
MTACNDKETKAGPTSSQLAQPMGTGQPGSTPGGSTTNGQATVRTVGKTGWYEGFDITVDKATVIPDEFGGAKVRVDITYKNTTTDNKTLSTVPTLLVSGQIDDGAGFDNPAVPGKGSATGNVTTTVQKLSDAQHLLDTLTVVYGTAAENQTVIPLRADAKVESTAPKALTISGTLVQDQTTIQITGGTLTPSYTTGEHGKMDLALHIKIIGGSGISDGGSNIFYEYFSVKTPDGQNLPADNRGPINELLERNQTIDNAKTFAIFVVPSPGTGTYVVTYDAKKGEGDAPTFSFTVN